MKKNALGALPEKYRIFSLSVLVVFLLIIITVIIWQLFREKQRFPSNSTRPTVVIMPFSNNSGDENLAYIGEALSDMLISDLSQSRYVTVHRRDVIISTLRELNLHKTKNFSSEDLRKIAQKLDATHFIQGSYIKFGDDYRIDVDTQDARLMESSGIDKVEGAYSELSSMVDSLARKIKSHLNLTDEAIAHDIDERVGRVTTSSPEALRYYIEGRNHHNLSAYVKSIESMEKALEIDPEFALAYKSLSESYNSLGLLSKSREYAAKALEHSDRISERERYHLQMQFYRASEKTWQNAIDAGLKLIRLYPDDLGGDELATLYFLVEQWDSAIQHYQVLVRNQEVSFFPYRGMASAYEAKGMYDKAADVLKSYLHDISEHPRVRWQLAYLDLCRGEYGRALEEAEKLDPPNSDIKGNIYHCSGEWDKAEGEYLNMLDSRISRDAFSARRYLGSLYLLQGRYDDARRQLTEGIAYADLADELSWKQEIHSDMAYYHLILGNREKALEQNSTALEHAVKGESIRGQIGSLHFRGLVLVKTGLLDEARRAAEELKKLIENSLNQKSMRYYYHLIGGIELKKRNTVEAIKNLKKAVALLPCQYYEWDFPLPVADALFYDSLARAYYESGDLDLALGQFEAILNLTAAKLSYGDKFAKSYFMLAKIFEKKGQREEAKKQYETYLDLLKDADEGIPEVAEAHKRLAVLKAYNTK
ncbi:MAG: hypothetical protein MUO28_03745 [Desulfobacterales bacterium]|nr:hypothetical protein [Desulfobacterales bacterium]